FFDLRRFLHVHGRLGVGAAATSIVRGAGDGVAARGQAGGIKLRGGGVAGNLAPRCRVAVGYRVAIRIRGAGIDGHAFAGDDRVAFGRAGDCRRTIRARGNRDISGATCRAAASVVHLDVDGVGAQGQAGGIPTHIGAGAVDRTAGRGVAVGERVIIRVAGVHVNRHGIRGTLINGRDCRRAGRHRRMIRLGWSWRIVPTNHDAAANPEVILPGTGG